MPFCAEHVRLDEITASIWFEGRRIREIGRRVICYSLWDSDDGLDLTQQETILIAR